MRKTILAAAAALLACFMLAAPASADPLQVRACLNSLMANGTYNCVDVSSSNPLPVTQTQLTYIPAPGNTTTTQLAASATFNGTIDQIVNEQVVSINMTSDQNITLTIHQYIDAAGTYELPTIAVNVPANTGFNQSYLINGNYTKITALNTGASTTTTFNLNTYYGPSQVPTGPGGLANVTVANASSITIGSVYLLDSGGTNKASINASGQLATVPPSTDPCETSGVAKSSVAIAVTSATTTSLVAVSGTKAVYVCGGAMTIAPSATSADTALLEYGTGASCTGTTAMTGTFGNGDLTTSAPPLAVTLPSELVAPASQGVCIVTAGTAVNVQGYLTYVQQ